jgi:hypothetical protein
MAREDPVEKIQKMIDDAVERAFENKSRSEREEKDPWARLEGIVSRAVDKRLAEQKGGSLKQEKEEGESKSEKKDGGFFAGLGIGGSE